MSKSEQGRSLGQSKPANTDAASIFAPTTLDLTAAQINNGVRSREMHIRHIIVCNVSASVAKYRIFFDDDGTTYDETTAIAWDVEIKVGESHFIDTFLIFDQNAGNLAVRSDSADALNFTITGELKR